MPFVKLDTGILNSTLWMDRCSREIFITALLMAEPFEAKQPLEQIKVRSLEHTGFVVPAGWYGFVPAAGVGIIARAGLEREPGLMALELLGSPEEGSRSRDFEGRRLVRVDGGYIVLNFMKYRDRDYTTADRSRRYRERKKALESHRDVTESQRDAPVTIRDITQAEAEAEAYTEKVKVKRFVPPALEEVAAYCKDRPIKIDPQEFIDWYTANGWRVGKNPMKDWRAAVRTWERSRKNGGNGNGRTYESKGEILERKNKETAERCRRELADGDGETVPTRFDFH